MTEGELLRRMDEHLGRGNEHMARGNEIMARSNEIMARSNRIMARNTAVIEEAREAFSDQREFIREMTVRQQLVTDRMIRQIDANTRELVAGRGVLEDISLATRQHTAALARVLDRLE